MLFFFSFRVNVDLLLRNCVYHMNEVLSKYVILLPPIKKELLATRKFTCIYQGYCMSFLSITSVL